MHKSFLILILVSFLLTLSGCTQNGGERFISLHPPTDILRGEKVIIRGETNLKNDTELLVNLTGPTSLSKTVHFEKYYSGVPDHLVNGTFGVEIPTEELPSGTYIVTVSDRGGIKQSSQFKVLPSARLQIVVDCSYSKTLYRGFGVGETTERRFVGAKVEAKGQIFKEVSGSCNRGLILYVPPGDYAVKVCGEESLYRQCGDWFNTQLLNADDRLSFKCKITIFDRGISYVTAICSQVS